MSGLKFAQKFAMIAVIFTIPTFVLTCLFVKDVSAIPSTKRRA